MLSVLKFVRNNIVFEVSKLPFNRSCTDFISLLQRNLNNLSIKYQSYQVKKIDAFEQKICICHNSYYKKITRFTV